LNILILEPFQPLQPSFSLYSQSGLLIISLLINTFGLPLCQQNILPLIIFLCLHVQHVLQFSHSFLVIPVPPTHELLCTILLLSCNLPPHYAFFNYFPIYPHFSAACTQFSRSFLVFTINHWIATITADIIIQFHSFIYIILELVLISV